MMTQLFGISFRPVWAVILPLLVALFVLLAGKKPNLRESVTLSGSLALCLVVLSMTPPVLKNGPILFAVPGLLPGVDFAFKADALGLVFATTSSCLWVLVSIYAIGYMHKEHARTRFYFSFALALAGAVGVAFAANLVTFFIFYELLTISTYPLVAHDESPKAISAGHKYLAYLLGGGVFFLAAILMTYNLTGTTDFGDLGILAPVFEPASGTYLRVLFFFFLIGFAKAAWMPLHSWLPSAMVAPAPVSALLHAVAVVKAGVFGITRVVCHIYGVELMQVLGLGVALASIAAVTVIIANVYAIGQKNLKKMLAYSTISQLSFILLGVGLLSPASVTGAILHIPFHGFMKITLFLCAGAAAAIAGVKTIKEAAGLGRKMPVTFTAFTIGAFGMCGLPPLAGFISKWHIASGAIESGRLFFLLIICTGSLLDVVYFFPVIRDAFFAKIPESAQEPWTVPYTKKTGTVETLKPLTLFMVAPLAVTAAFSVLFCLFPNMFGIYDLTLMAVTTIFKGM
ncbi:MAG: monovalent cation/H+ antiporter subunit D family protein [Desulfobacterales bacterium]|nr:monovalent cation/H+ antiporter subunit D family protein [Desulfobacterales bacterium]